MLSILVKGKKKYLLYPASITPAFEEAKARELCRRKLQIEAIMSAVISISQTIMSGRKKVMRAEDYYPTSALFHCFTFLFLFILACSLNPVIKLDFVHLLSILCSPLSVQKDLFYMCCVQSSHVS